MIFLVNLVIILTLLTNISSLVTQNHRQKRYLIFPRAAPTRNVFIAGVGIPLGLDYQSVTNGYVMKAQYYLPYTVDQLKFTWASPEKVHSRAKLEKRSLTNNSTMAQVYLNSTDYIDPETEEVVEKYDGKIEQIDLQSLNEHVDIEVDYSKDYVWRSKYVEDESIRNDHSRWMLYKIIEGVLNNKNLNGRECLKRVICEAAATQFGHENGIFGELIHVMLRPSSTSELYSHESDEEFDRAEELGKQQKPCEFHYAKCGLSLIDIFSTIL